MYIHSFRRGKRKRQMYVAKSPHTLRGKKELPDLGKTVKTQKLYFLKSGQARLFSVIQSENTATNSTRMFNP